MIKGGSKRSNITRKNINKKRQTKRKQTQRKGAKNNTKTIKRQSYRN